VSISSRSVNKHGRHRQFLFLIGRFLKKSSPLKLHGHMNWNLVGSIYVRSSTKNVHFVPILWQTWPPQAILVSDWLISKKSSTLKPLCQMNRNLVGSIYGRSSIWPPQAILITDWSISQKSSPLKPSSQMNRNLVVGTYERFCIKFPQNRKKGERHRLSPLSL